MNPVNNPAFQSPVLPELLFNSVENKVLSANKKACDFLGTDIQTLKNLIFSDLFKSQLLDLIVFTDEVRHKGKAWTDQLYICKPGSEEKIRIEVSAQCLSEDLKENIYITFQDAELLRKKREKSEANAHYRMGLGQWKRIENVFRDFERKNKLILDAVGEGIYGVNAEGETTFVNPTAARILGWKAEELIGKNAHSLIHFRHRDGSPNHAETCPIYQAFRDGLVNQTEDDVFWRKDGIPIDVEYTSTPIRDNGLVVGAVVIFKDITEKKNNEVKLLQALSEVESLKKRLELENAYLQEEIRSEFNHHQIIGKSNGVQNILRKIELVAPTDATVLIYGESGTGKELIARAIHDLSPRKGSSLIRVNCAAIPKELFESEFFGHNKGAFTGAVSDRIGRFELADCGTLFLDEVGEIPLNLQGKLLRVLQEQQFERVGESTTRHVNVRIIAATNRDLKTLVKEGNFREDLYFRLQVFPIESIPLRNRKVDIPLLAQHFLKKSTQKARKEGLKISLNQLNNLQKYHWPGNIRELENVIERQVILTSGKSLQFQDLVPEIEASVSETIQSNKEIISEKQWNKFLKSNIENALKKTHGKISGPDGAAELLGIAATTLASRIKSLKITVAEFVMKGK